MKPIFKRLGPPPQDLAEWQSLSNLTQEQLTDLGLRPWCRIEDPGWPIDRVLMAFPQEWYSAIPNGLQLVDIFGKTMTFDSTTSNDQRYGYLAYGVLAAREG